MPFHRRGAAAVALLLLLPLVGSASAGLTGGSVVLPDPADAATHLTRASDRTPHPTITIRGDLDLCKPGSGVVNCGSASGSSWDDAYEIRGWKISGSANTPALLVTGTTKFLRVTGVAFTTDMAGDQHTIVLTNSRHVWLDTNVIDGTNASAVSVNGLHESFITGNTITQVSARPGSHALVDLHDSPDLLLAGNVLRAAEGALDGADALLGLTASHGVILDSNRYGPLNGTGIHVRESLMLTSADETWDTVRIGLVAENADGLEVAGANMNRTLDGVRVYESEGVVMTSSTVVDNFPCEPGCESTGVYAMNSEVSLDSVVVESFDDGIVIISSSTSTAMATTSADAEDELDLDARRLTLRDNGRGLHVMGDVKVKLKWSNVEGNGVGVENGGVRAVKANTNWWGCSSGPGASGCDSVTGSVDWPPHATQRFA